jgi:hypothetical protein
MKKLLVAAALLGLAIAPARADYYVKDGNGVLKLFKAGTLAGSVVLPYNSLTDASGLPFGTNSNPVALKFGSGVLLPDFASPQHVICDSGCSGGGGGSSYTVTYGQPIGTLGTPAGFKDGSGNFQALLGDVTNGQWVSIRASVPLSITGTVTVTGPLTDSQLRATPVPVSGSVSAAVTGSVSLTGTLPAFAATPTFNLGTLNGAATAALQSSVQGTVAGGTAATASQLAGAIYNSAPLTLTNGQGAALQADVNGYLRVNVMTGGGGSSTFGAAFPASGVAIGMSQGGNMVAATGTSGNLNVQCANCSGSGVSTADAATFTAGASLFAGSGGFFQTTATANALTNGQQGMFQVTAQRALFTNLRNASGTELGVAAAPLQVSLANTAANGTALLVTGTGGTFPVSQASAASLNATVVGTGTFAVQSTIATPTAWGINTLGSTTSGQSGQLALGAVTTAAPTYTTAQSNALSLTTAGALRVDGSGVTQPVSLTSTTITGTVAVTQSGSWSLAANQSVNIAQFNGVTPLMGNGVTGTGSPRVTIASDNTPFTVNAAQSGTWNVTNISGTITLPTGAATAANQSTMISSLSTIASNTGGAVPVVLNAVVTAQTGLTPGATSSSQTGTIVAANVDLSSQAGVALGVPTAYGTAPSGRSLSANAFVTNFGTGTAGSPAGGVVTVQGATTMTPIASTPTAGTTGAATPSFVVAANSNNSTNLKASPGTVYGIQLSNISATIAYFFKLYDKASAPTCGTDTPVAAYVIPPSNGGNNVVLSVGKAFSLGIGYCIVAGIANNDNTSVPAATVLANVDWK